MSPKVSQGERGGSSKCECVREREREKQHNIAVSPRVGELFCLKLGVKRWCDRSCGARRPANPVERDGGNGSVVCVCVCVCVCECVCECV